MIEPWQMAEYETELAFLTGQAKSLFREFVSRLDLDSTDALESLVEFTEGMDEYCGDAAAALGTDKFAEFTGEEPDILHIVDSRIKQERFRKSIEDGLRKTVRQGLDARRFADVMDGRIERYVRERAAYATIGNVKSANKRKRKRGKRKDDDPGVWWAFVPEPDACDFCIMQGSRGWMKTSSKKEGKAEFHDFCRCKVVASVDCHVAGYYPDEYYDMWKHPDWYRGLAWTTKQSLAACRVAEKSGLATYLKPLSEFVRTDEGRRDLFAHAALAHNGVSYTALPEDSPEGFSNIDLLINGEKWEVKSPDGDNQRAVESSLRRAKDQFENNYPEPIDAVNVILNGKFYGQDDDWIAKEAIRQKAIHDLAKVQVVRKDGAIG